MTMYWYEWGNIRNKLVYFGRAMQGISPYRVIVESDIIKCPSGYCDFTNREIAVNPALFPKLQPKDQYQLTKALLVHEAGHRRFTDPKELPPIVDQVANILEDERIERQMCSEFVGVRWLIKKLSAQLYKETKTLDEKTDNPGEVIGYFLQLRWASQIGKPLKGGLSPKNQDLWEKIKDLVFEAWEAETFDIVCKNAEEIVRILGYKIIVIPAWAVEILRKLGSFKGKRIDGDWVEKISGAILKDKQSKNEGKPEPFDGEVLPNKSREGKGSEAISPKPYLELEERVKPLAKELIDELIIEEKPLKLEPEERGSRFSVREYIRDETRPFLCDEGLAKTPPTINLKIIVDHSTSLNFGKVGRYTRIESMSQAIMTLHLVCLELGILHEVIVTPHQIKIADLESGERGKALIAGLSPALCGYEDMGLAIKNHALPMVDCPEDVKLVLCLTDGACNDAELGKEICRALRGRVEVIGVLLDPEAHTKSYLDDMFGEDRVIACNAAELPQKLGNILRAIRGI
jgi:hypothetical protein